MVTKLSSKVTYLDRLLPIMSHDLLITLFGRSSNKLKPGGKLITYLDGLLPIKPHEIT